MTGITLDGSKVVLAVTNFLLLACGFSLTSSGILLLFDAERVLLSTLIVRGPFANLPHPLFHYVAIFLTVLGLTMTAIGILGCWASCIHNDWLISIYFTLIMALLICECTVYAVMWMWPKCGLDLNSRQVGVAIHERYAYHGNEQLTAAVDLFQTSYNCCGFSGTHGLHTPFWVLSIWPGPSYRVPLSCCILKNPLEYRSYLNPIPLNKSGCLAIDHNEGYRHSIDCDEPLQQWYRKHYLAFLGIGLVVVLVEFVVLLSTILTCPRIYHYNQECKENDDRAQDLDDASSTFPKRRSSGHSYSNETYAMTESFRQNYKLLDKA